MKGIVLIFLALSNIALFGNPSDTTVTTFEIHLKRKSADDPLGFNTCNIDRNRIYNVVIERLQHKLETQAFTSLHNPQVLMKFHDVSGKVSREDRKQVSKTDLQALKKRNYNYFVKVFGNLDIDCPLYQYQKATFVLKVYIFDANGKLVHKYKAKSRDNNVGVYKAAEVENYPLSEQEFIDLVTRAADTLDVKQETSPALAKATR
jgi:hypothetical protein